MKSLYLIIACFFILPCITFGQLSVGGNATYAQWYEKPGIQLRASYQINKRLRPSIDYVRYIRPSTAIRTAEINTNLHYLFLNKEKVNIYGLAGLNIFTNRIKDSVKDERTTTIGFNVGGGVDFKLSKNVSLNLEVKHTYGEFVNHWLFGAGVVRKF